MGKHTYSDFDRCCRRVEIGLRQGRLLASRDVDAAMERCTAIALDLARSQRVIRDIQEAQAAGRDVDAIVAPLLNPVVPEALR